MLKKLDRPAESRATCATTASRLDRAMTTYVRLFWCLCGSYLGLSVCFHDVPILYTQCVILGKGSIFFGMLVYFACAIYSVEE